MGSFSKLFSILFLLELFLVPAQNQAATPVDITIDRGGIILKGKFYFAEGEKVFPTLILLGGMPGNENDVLGLGNLLSESGINVLTFNYCGTYQSQGELSFANAQLDIQEAFDFIYRKENILKFKIDTANIYLGGWCFGGGMALTYAANHPEITAVFSIAGNDHGEFLREYISNAEMRKMIDDMFTEITAPEGPVRFEAGATPKEMAEAGIENLDPTLDLKKIAPQLAKKNILLIAAWNDAQVTIDQYILPFYRALQKEKARNVKITAFQDDHYFRNSRNELAQIIAGWINTEIVKKN